MKISERDGLVDCKERLYRVYRSINGYCISDVVKKSPNGVFIKKLRDLVEKQGPVALYVYHTSSTYELRELIDPVSYVCTKVVLEETEVSLDEKNGTLSVSGCIPDGEREKILKIGDINIYSDIDEFKIDCIERNSGTIFYYGQGNIQETD